LLAFIPLRTWAHSCTDWNVTGTEGKMNGGKVKIVEEENQKR
jgi:hypothetical protein